MAWDDGESLGIPTTDPNIGRRRGLLSVLANLAQGGQQEEMPQGTTSRPSSTWTSPGPTLRDRVTDDPTTRANHEMTGEAYGEGLRQAPVGQSSGQRAPGFEMPINAMSELGGGTAPDQLSRMQSEYNRLGQTQPLSLKDKILRSIVGGLGSEGTRARLQQQDEFEETQRNQQRGRLLQEIEAERRMQEQEGLATQRMTLQERMERDREEAAAARQQPEHMDTDQGPLQWNRDTRQWEPITVGGQRVGPKAQPKPDTPEQQFFDSPEEAGKSLTQRIADYARITQKPERSDAAEGRAAARGDRSYQFNAGRVDKLATPIEQRAERLSRLTDTLAQGSPQADALVAPELLTVMAGGQGSGLRMNEAEISRVIGGRTVWEGIKAKLDAYQIDPSKGFALTPAQRQQVGTLMRAVQQRVNQKMQVLDEERQNLSATDDPMEHRKIVNRLQKRLSEADTAGGGQGGGEQQTGKTATRQHLQDYANQKGISVQQAEQEFKQYGYTIK